jgi:hypothetical protein
MSKDIFMLAAVMAGKKNPIVTALLYEFCPAAAHWYVRNVQTEDVYDVVWQALEDYGTGKSLAECLEGYGLASLIPSIKNYVKQVTLFRSRYSAIGPAPELLPLFTGDHLNQRAIGLQNELNNLGGTWKSVLVYVRVWAFLIRDWKTQMKIPAGDNATRAFRKFTISLSAHEDDDSSMIHFPIWGWEVKTGKVHSIYLGLLVSVGRQDVLRFALVSNSYPVGEKTCPSRTTHIFGLDRELGTAEPISLPLQQRDALSMILPMYEAACKGPNFPLSMLRDRNTCHFCGYRKACCGEKGYKLSPAVVQQLIYENIRERGRPHKLP